MSTEGDVRTRTWLAVSVAPRDETALHHQVRALRPWVDAVEVRLDLMSTVPPPTVLGTLPLPTVVTCRPVREGGHYTGPESERIALLREAGQAGVAAVDIEWDAAEALEGPLSALRIVSRHFFTHSPDNLFALWDDLAARGADVVKLATYAHTLLDALRVCELFRYATRPTIAIAMGEAGLLTRLIAPFFPTAFLTYGAQNDAEAVAPGQVSVRRMREHYHVHRIRPGIYLYGYLAPDANKSHVVAEINAHWYNEDVAAVLLPLQPTPEDELANVLARAWGLGFQGVWVAPPLAPAVTRQAQTQAVWVYPDGHVTTSMPEVSVASFNGEGGDSWPE